MSCGAGKDCPYCPPDVEKELREAVIRGLDMDHYRRYISLTDAATDVVPEVLLALRKLGLI